MCEKSVHLLLYLRFVLAPNVNLFETLIWFSCYMIITSLRYRVIIIMWMCIHDNAYPFQFLCMTFVDFLDLFLVFTFLLFEFRFHGNLNIVQLSKILKKMF